MFRGLLRPGPARLARCAFVAVACVTATARADDAADREARARELFVEGRDQVQRGDIVAGCQKLRESHALSPDAVGPLLNVGDCDERAGRLATALSRFRRAAALAPEGDHRRAFAERRVASVEPRVPRLVLEMAPGMPAGTRVTQDGKAVDVAALPKTRMLDPGIYRFQVTAPGRTPRAMTVALAAGTTQRLVLAAGGAPGAAATRAPSDGTGEDPSTGAVAGFALITLGSAALVLGVVGGIMVGVLAGTYEDHCQDGICDQEGLDAAQAGRVHSVLSPVSLGIAAVALGVGIPLWFNSQDATVPPPRVGASVAPGAFRVGLRGSF
jgi:hypothetical protein